MERRTSTLHPDAEGGAESAHAIGVAPTLSLASLRWYAGAALGQWWRVWSRRLAWNHALIAVELGLVVIWTLVIVGPLLDLNPMLTPPGREWGQSIVPHHLWTNVAECGLCGLWYGGARGGSPVAPDALYGAHLHPLVALTALGWGVLNGSKLALAASFLMAGLAQWWLGYMLGAGPWARVWTAAVAIAGGQLASRLHLGSMGLVLSTAACALVLPPLIGLWQTGS